MRAVVDGIAPTMNDPGDPAPITATTRRMAIAPKTVTMTGKTPPRRTGLGGEWVLGGWGAHGHMLWGDESGK